MRKVYVIIAQMKKINRSWVVGVYTNRNAAEKKRIEIIADNYHNDREYYIEIHVLQNK